MAVDLNGAQTQRRPVYLYEARSPLLSAAISGGPSFPGLEPRRENARNKLTFLGLLREERRRIKGRCEWNQKTIWWPSVRLCEADWSLNITVCVHMCSCLTLHLYLYSLQGRFFSPFEQRLTLSLECFQTDQVSVYQTWLL